MAITKINLRKLLQYFGASTRHQRLMLLDDIRKERGKAAGIKSEGGDFYSPFWSDVKGHAAGGRNISDSVEARVSSSKQRARLYPILRDAFLDMWKEQIRWRNEPFSFTPRSVHSQLEIRELGAIVKIENTGAIIAWDGTHRVMYPYFYEEPALSKDNLRLGFWALKEALPQYNMEEFRIIDFVRRGYHRPSDVQMTGNEKGQFLQRYSVLINEWERLRNERK